MFDTFCSRARTKVLEWRRKGSGIGINHDIRTTTYSRTLDLQFALSLMLISGLIVIVVVVVVSIRVAPRAAGLPL